MEAMNQAIWTKKSATTFKFADTCGLSVRRMMTFSRKNLQKQRRIWQTTMELSQVKYQYIDDPRLHKIVIFWQYS